MSTSACAIIFRANSLLAHYIHFEICLFGSFCGAKACGAKPRKMPRKKKLYQDPRKNPNLPPSSLRGCLPGHIMMEMSLITSE